MTILLFMNSRRLARLLYGPASREIIDIFLFAKDLHTASLSAVVKRVCCTKRGETDPAVYNEK